MISREEHIEWCKERAIAYIDNNDPVQAWMSFVSDMSKHDDTKDNIAMDLGTRTMNISSVDNLTLRKFIEGVM